MKLYMQYASNQEIGIINYQQWRLSWYAFLELLDIDYSSGFRCVQCGQYPNVLSCDATTLAFKREYAQKINVNRHNLESGALLKER